MRPAVTAPAGKDTPLPSAKHSTNMCQPKPHFSYTRYKGMEEAKGYHEKKEKRVYMKMQEAGVGVERMEGDGEKQEEKNMFTERET